jgi:crotonobetainyl-CoA:carnitine CoA-transferase CaiB-like acyl-CoA transferase
MEIDPASLPPQMDRARWPQARARFAERFLTRTRDEWCAILEGTDSCFAPVLSMAEAPQHPHNRARGAFIELDGVTQPAPAPRFSRTPSVPPAAPETPGAADAREVLRAWGLPSDSIQAAADSGILT